MKKPNTATKSLSYVLSRMYPGAFASYQGMVFRVTNKTGGPLAGLTADFPKSMEASGSLLSDWGQRLRTELSRKLDRQLAQYGLDALGIGQLHIVYPQKIDLTLDQNVLNFVYCTNPGCGRIDRVSAIVQNIGLRAVRRCLSCKSPMGQAPIWVPVKRGSFAKPHGLQTDTQEELLKDMGFAQSRCPMFRYNGRVCNHPDNPTGSCDVDYGGCGASMKMTNPNRPIDSLVRFKNDCPHGYKTAGIPFQRLYGTPDRYYKMDFPRESMTTGLRVTAVMDLEPDEGAESLIAEVNERLAEVKAARFNSRLVDLEKTRFAEMRVLECTYGYAIGNRFSGFYRFYVGAGPSNQVPGRLITTQGFVLALGPGFFARLEQLRAENPRTWGKKPLEELAEIALHSLKHALLVLAPMYTGFEPDKFFGSYSIDLKARTAKVHVYDAEEGGNGGFASLIREPRFFTELLDRVIVRLGCPTRECAHACKQCLFIKNCGEVNRNLNRKLLRELQVLL